MLSDVFIKRPRLAGVISIVLTIAGLIAVTAMPVERYPEIAPPVVQVRGQVEVRDETVSMRATEMQPVALETDDERPFLITLPLVALGRGNMQQLAQIITRHPGFCEVRLAVLDAKGNAQVMTFGDRFRVKRDTSLFAEIKSLFGPSCLPTA